MDKNISKLRDVLLRMELSVEEKDLISQSDNWVDNIQINISDELDPREKATYRFDRKRNRFLEQTGVSNYITRYTPLQFVRALKMFDYKVNVTLA